MKEKIKDILEKHYFGRNRIEEECAKEILLMLSTTLIETTEPNRRLELNPKDEAPISLSYEEVIKWEHKGLMEEGDILYGIIKIKEY